MRCAHCARIIGNSQQAIRDHLTRKHGIAYTPTPVEHKEEADLFRASMIAASRKRLRRLTGATGRPRPKQ